MPPHDILALLVQGRALSSDQAEAFFEDLLGGRLDPAQIAAALALIQSRGAAVDELVGAARAMRRHVTAVPWPCAPRADQPPAPATAHDPLIDTCGTGGAAKTFNVSTCAAIVAAAARVGGRRVRVAKHGNRSRTGRGSAEVLATLGVNVDAGPDLQARCLQEAGVCFCFAIHHHPAMRHAAGPRRALGFPTIFNLLGPLTNPAGARRQLIGVYAPRLVETVGRALAALGAERAMVVHGLEGIDEVSIGGRTLVARVEAGRVDVGEIDAAGFALARCEAAALRAQSLDEAARRFTEVLEGQPGPHADVVALNAAAALVVGGVVETLADGLAASREAIASGRARQTLEALARVSHGRP